MKLVKHVFKHVIIENYLLNSISLRSSFHTKSLIQQRVNSKSISFYDI